MTKDLSPTVVEATVQYRLEEPQKSLLKYDKFRSSLNHISHSTLRKLALEYDLDDLFRSQIAVNDEYKKRLDSEFSQMGLIIVRTEIREIDPVGPVKAAIEDRIAAEKERQAMILRADGKRKAILMEAEALRSTKDR
jgi:regulator of protease activity HflC (stomatin/prohibitin superfamily)